MTPTVCLVSAAPIWVNPRLVKEADALHSAGYQVVVGYRADGDVTRDDEVLRTKPWGWHRIDVGRRRVPARWVAAGLRQKAAERLVRAGLGTSAVQQAAYCRGDSHLLEWAAAQQADLYIAHTQPVLSVVARAAKRRAVPFAFDCEDLLAEETADGGRAPWRRSLITALERRHLPNAAYVSTTSEPMAAYLRAQYGLRRVSVWHNCFPSAATLGIDEPTRRPPTPRLPLVWLSATIGRGRGLEDIFAALRRVSSPVDLHLYGTVAAGCESWVDAAMAAVGGRHGMYIHPPVSPDRIIEAVAGCAIGLSLDGDSCLNRRLTVPNKVFYYLQAGIPCVATDTPGHRSVLQSQSPHCVLYPPGDVDALSAALARVMSPDVLPAAQRSAWAVGRTAYRWDVEQTRFLDAVASTIGEAGEHAQPDRAASRG